MGYGYAYNGPPTKCSGGPKPGTVALSTAVMERFRCGTQGIYNCRPIRVTGATILSFHADGRAWDAKCSGDLNEQVFQFLIAHADELGIQEAISKRRRWDSRTRKIAHYGGDDPHTDHVHTTQCSAAAAGLTLTEARRICGSVAAQGGPATPAKIQEDDDMMIYTLEPGAGPDGGKSFYVIGNKRRHLAPENYQSMRADGVPERAGVDAPHWQVILDTTTLATPNSGKPG